MRRIRDRVAGLDVHRDSVTACVEAIEPGAVEPVVDKTRFATTAKGVRELAAWLADWGVTTVAMEATGVYWKPVFYRIEGLFEEVWLVNAQHVKNVPGRKTDMADAEWLADVVAHGMVRPSFVPPPPIRELRELTRYRKNLVDERSREIQRLDKVLQDAGIKLSSVASKVMTKSGRKMIEALITGETNSEVLANLAEGRMKAKIPALIEAMEGMFGAHHAVVCRHILDHIDFLDDSIDQLSEEVVARMGPYEAAISLIQTIPGVARTTAEVIVAETGADMSRFPTAGHLCAWAGVAPASNESAGKHRPAGTRKGGRWLRRHLIEAARAAARTKGTYLAAQHQQIRRRRGDNKAIVAVANSILSVVWHLLTTGETYNDLGAEHFQTRDRDVQARRLRRRLEALGYQVTLEDTAA